jgi:DNA-binding NtrC family response regulator
VSQRVLIVDDNRDLAENLGELLELEGYETTVMSSSRRALEEGPTLEFDVALLDVRMPDVDGIDLCAALARSHPRATFVLMTAFTAEARLAEASSAGAAAVLPKPVPVERLLTLLVQGARSVLLVEDDEALRASLRAELEDRGFKVVSVDSLAQAEEHVERGVPPYAVLELVVDERCTEPLAQRLLDAGARVVVLGAADDPRGSGLVPRGVLYLDKPIATGRIVELLGRLARKDLS